MRFWRKREHEHDWYPDEVWDREAGTTLLWDQCNGCQTIRLKYVKRQGFGSFDPDFERTWVTRIWSRYTVEYVGAMAGKELS